MGICSAAGSWIANHKICSGLAAATLLVIITVLGWPIARAKTSAVIKTPDHSRAEGLRWENERLRQAAIARAESAARDEGDETAARATEQIRKTGDTALLLEFLLHQRQKIQAKAGKDCIEINREISALAFLRGEISTAQEAVNQILQVEPDDLIALYRKGYIHDLQGEVAESQESYLRILDLATARNDRTWQATAVACLRGDNAVAKEAVNQILQVLSPDKLSDLSHKGHIHHLQGEVAESQESYQRILDLATARNDRPWQATAYGSLGVLCALRGDLDDAEGMYRKALHIWEALGRKDEMANQYSNLGLVYDSRGDLARAREYWIKARDLYKQIPMPHMVKRVQSDLDELDAKVSPANARSQGRAAEPP